MHCNAMLTTEPHDAPTRGPRDTPPDPALGELLDGLHRIVDGFGGIAEALIARPDPTPRPAPTVLTADEQAAMDVIESALIDTLTRGGAGVTVPAGWLAIVYRIACERVLMRGGAKP